MVPVPVIVVEPTDSVTVHVPATGKPLSATLPVATVQVGCVIAPTTGAVGGKGIVLITALTEATEIHPAAFVTVNV